MFFLRFTVLSIFVFISGINTLQAQTFVRLDNSGNTGSFYNDVAVLTNGSYVCAGATRDSVSPSFEMLINIYSSTGNLINQVQSNRYNYEANAVAATFDGGFVVAGRRNDAIGTNPDDFLFNKYNSVGDSLWGKVYTSSAGTPFIAYDVIQLPDSGFVIAGSLLPTVTSLRSEYFVLRTDAQGNKLWEHQGGTVNSDMAKRVIQTQDGGFLVTGISDTSYYLAPEKGFALKLDANGNQQWIRFLNDFTASEEVPATQTLNGEYLVARKGFNGNSSLYRLNAQGVVMSNTEYIDTANPGAVYYNDIITNADGTYSITGAKAVSGGLRYWLINMDDQLNTVWYKTYGDSLAVQNSTYMGYGLTRTPDNGYALVGRWSYHRGVLIKTDSLGNVLNGTIKGKLIADQNENCTLDTGEGFAARKIVKATTANSVFYGLSNNNGQYEITVYDTGQVEVSWLDNDSYWTRPSCQGVSTIVNVLPYDTTHVDLFSKITTYCPRLSVNLYTRGLRRCFGGNSYTVTYCNNGTVVANNSYVELDVDQYLYVDSASIPFTAPTTGNTYRFDLGNIDVNQCGSFLVWVTVDCDSTVLGQAHCVEARIYPDTICEPVEPTWDQSSLTLVSQCQESDSTKFTISNLGTGNMSAPSTYTVIENNTVIAQVTFQLNAGESLDVLLPGNGSTYTVIVPQSAGHPGSSAPLRVVEGCGRDDNGNFRIGYLTMFPQDDENESVDILCAQNRGSFDPNQKTPEPLGVGIDGFINATQRLDYTIQFQNTGTDTAFTVVLRDTLPQHLDITSIRLTGASHEYTFQIEDSNILVWTFANILLPDSNINEPLSHGFAAFTINQKQGNTPGTVIQNRAGIYFDFNEPVITNYTLNTVVEDYKNELETSVSIQELNAKTNLLKLYPNPNTGQFYVELLEAVDGTPTIAIFDLAGKQVAHQQITGQGPNLVDVQSLEAGMYFYTISLGAENLGNGKLLVEKR